MKTKVDNLIIASATLFAVTIVHSVVYYGIVIANGEKCALKPGCPSWQIPGNVETYAASGFIQVVVVLRCLWLIYTPCRMRYFQHVEDQRVAGNPCLLASTSVGTSALLGLWLVSSFLNIFIAVAYESQEYPSDYKYYLHVTSILSFILLDILLIWLVAGVSQLYMDSAARFSADPIEKQQFQRFRGSVWLIAIRIFVGIVYLVVQFVVDYVITANGPGQPFLSLYLYGAFTMIVLMMLYKIYLVQLMVRKAVSTARDPFASTISSFDIADPYPTYDNIQ